MMMGFAIDKLSNILFCMVIIACGVSSNVPKHTSAFDIFSINFSIGIQFKNDMFANSCFRANETNLSSSGPAPINRK